MPNLDRLATALRTHCGPAPASFRHSDLHEHLNGLRARLSCAAVAALLLPGAAHAVDIRVAAVLGDPAVGLQDARYFAQAQINDRGDIAGLVALLDGSGTGWTDTGVVLGRAGAFTLLARSNEPVSPQNPDDRFTRFGAMTFNNRGQLVVADSYHIAVNSTVSYFHSRLFAFEQGEFVSIAQAGDRPPGLPAGMSLGYSQASRLANNGTFFYWSQLQGEGMLPNENAGIFAGPLGSSALLARSGQQAPGLLAGVQFHWLYEPNVSHSGDAVFYSTLAGQGVTLANYQSLWHVSQSQPSLIVRSGDPAPHFPGMILSEVQPWAVAGGGDQVAFIGNVTPAGFPQRSNWTLFHGAAADPRPVLTTSDPAPGLPEFSMSFVDVLRIDHQGRLIFTGHLYGAGGGYFQSAIWRTSATGIDLLFSNVRPMAGLEPDQVLRYWSTMIGDNGRIAVNGDAVVPGAWYEENATLLVEGRDGIVRRVLAKGDVVTLPSAVTGAVGSIGLLSPMNARGELLAQVSLVGGPTVLLLVDVDELCPADFNADAAVDPDDLGEFITCFFLDIMTPGTCPDADFNHDGFRDPDDLSDFITAFFSPCP